MTLKVGNFSMFNNRVQGVGRQSCLGLIFVICT